ncbi:MAG: RsmB/NOP family class I SAM-dependent RNA methyltransferase [Desulfovibrio sp.]|jgi:16S rRNA (cytosine1407-C5)-methyltransferase|nr:RsmB/NOP family class I SAM-dependent RNA methyltransferase [Desulfovibrio sp.]
MSFPSPRSFRMTCVVEEIPQVEDLLRAQGFVFETDPFYAPARRLLRAPLPLGAGLAAFFGCIYIQDRSSMLPPLALEPAAGENILDICASPGGKTSMLARMGGDCFVLGNEPAPKRLTVLRANLHAQNLLNCATVSCPGEDFPLPGVSFAGWDAILLDPPCSGWGTVEKNPGVRKLWRGDKIKTLTGLQRRLLARAARLLRPGGRLVYSTCTGNGAENEEQIRYACEELGLEFTPLSSTPPFFALEEAYLPQYTGVWRIRTGGACAGDFGGQGFFVAVLRKPWDCRTSGKGSAGTRAPGTEDRPGRESGGNNFPEPVPERFNFENARYGNLSANPCRGTVAKRTCLAVKRQFQSENVLGREVLAGPYLDPSLLPDGDVTAFGNQVYFLPGTLRTAPELAVRPYCRRGFLLGSAGMDGRIRTNPRLRALMPTRAALAASGTPFLSVDEVGPLLDLLEGRGLGVKVKMKEIGLYFRDLPLCRLSVKGGRAVLPPLGKTG